MAVMGLHKTAPIIIVGTLCRNYWGCSKCLFFNNLHRVPYGL